jgi:hypothetical protein
MAGFEFLTVRAMSDVGSNFRGRAEDSDSEVNEGSLYISSPRNVEMQANRKQCDNVQ